MSEPTVDDADRQAILEALVRKPKVQEGKVEPTNPMGHSQPKMSEVAPSICECGHNHEGKCTNKYCTCVEAKIPEKKGLTTFGSLLEQSLEKRAKLIKEETQEADEARRIILEKVNTGFIKNWKF